MNQSQLGDKSFEEDADRLRTLMGLGSVPAGATNHSTLTGLGNDDHAQYVHISAARTISAQHSFSPGSAQAPFLLGANAQGQTVVGLKADQLNKTISVGSGLTGGGALTGNVSLGIDTAVVATLTGVQTLTNKTLTSPTISDFTNATHNHQNAAGGGQLNAGSVFSAGQMPLARGGTNADLSATGGAGQYLRQATTGAAITVGTLVDSDIPATLVRTSRQIVAGAGLTGGGDLSANRTLDVVAADSSILVNADSLQVQLATNSGLVISGGLALGTPSPVTASSTSVVTTNTHSHQADSTLARSAISIGVSGLGLSGGGDLTANRTITITSSSNPGAAASLLASDASGQLTLVNLLANTTTFNLVNTTATTINFGAAATTINVGAAAGTVSLAGTLLTPVTTYNTDLGQITKPFKSIYAAELRIGTIVADTYQATIGGRVLVGPTTYLIADTANAISLSAPTQAVQAAGTGISITFAHTTTTGINTMLMVVVHMKTAIAGQDVSTLTFNGTGLTLHATQQDGGSNIRTTIWYLINPTPATASIVVTASGGTPAMKVSAFNCQYVNQATPFGTAIWTGGLGTSSSLSPATAVGELPFDAISVTAGVSGSLVSTGTGQSAAIYNTSATWGSTAAASTNTPIAGNSTVPMSWSWTGSQRYAQIATSIKPQYTIDTKHNDLNNGDIVYLQANGGFEAMSIASTPATISGGYRYNVTRDLDRTGLNSWNAGDSVFNTGTTGNGFIDLYSLYSTISLPLEYVYNFNNTGSAYSANYATNNQWQPFADGANTEVNDAIYFGVGATSWNNLYFNLTTAAAYAATLVWEFWNGAVWSAFTPTFVGNTSGDFKATGWQGFEWTVASLTSWATTSVNSVTAYWVRVRISAFTSWTTTPQQSTYRVNRGKGQIGPAIVMWGRNSSTWNDLTANVAIGKIPGLFGITTTAPGIGIGDYANGNYLRYDTGNGFSLKTGSGIVTLDASGITITAQTAVALGSTIKWTASGSTVTDITSVLAVNGNGSSIYSAYGSGAAKSGSLTLQAMSDSVNQNQNVQFVLNSLLNTSSEARLYGASGTFTGLIIGAATTPNAMLDVRQATLNSAVQALTSIATNDDPTEMVYQGRAATTDATITSLFTLALSGSITYQAQAIVTARRTGGSSGSADDAAAYVINAVFKAQALLTSTTTVVGESQAAWDAVMDASGNALRVRVTGAANNNVTWHCTIRVWQVGT